MRWLLAKHIVLAFVAVGALAFLALAPPTHRRGVPTLSAMDAIRIASEAMAQKGPHYYCASVILQAEVMAPEPRFAARHWQLIFYEADHPRVAEPDGRETFGDIELHVSMTGEVFGMRQLFIGPFPKPAK